VQRDIITRVEKGCEPCHFILSFDNGAFSEHGMFSITNWINVTPKDLLALNFGVPKDILDAFPPGRAYIVAGPVVPIVEAHEQPLPKEQLHKFSLHGMKATHDFEGGSLRLATANEFPVSQGMSGGVMTIKPEIMCELHWHPNANQ